VLGARGLKVMALLCPPTDRCPTINGEGVDEWSHEGLKWLARVAAKEGGAIAEVALADAQDRLLISRLTNGDGEPSTLPP
jgi:hypothetical protein